MSSSEEEEPDALLLADGPVVIDRTRLPVGQAKQLPGLVATCLGDDVSWKGSQTTRLATIQTGGVGADWQHWGDWWGRAISELGADVATLVETWHPGEGAAGRARAGLLAQGYVGILHNVAAPGGRGSGVALAVRAGYAGSWQHVARDTSGRGLAANLVLADGAVVRFIALYGVVGANSPGFRSRAGALQQERLLREFLESQLDEAARHNWAVVALGDFNSFLSLELDRWAAGAVLREDTLASCAYQLGLVDIFRAQHPDTRAFTFFWGTNGASRLDQIWVKSPPGYDMLVANAAILWNWSRRVDHDPVVVDLICTLPVIPDHQNSRAQEWRQLVRGIQGPQREHLAWLAKQNVLCRQQIFSRLRSTLDFLKLALQSRTDELAASAPSAMAGYSEGMFSWAPAGDPRSPEWRDELSRSFAELQDSLAQCLPKMPAPGQSTAQKRATFAWEECLRKLRWAKQQLQQRARLPPGTRARVPASVSADVARLQPLWDKGVAMSQRLQARTGQAARPQPNWDWDGFYSAAALALGCQSQLRLALPLVSA